MQRVMPRDAVRAWQQTRVLPVAAAVATTTATTRTRPNPCEVRKAKYAKHFSHFSHCRSSIKFQYAQTYFCLSPSLSRSPSLLLSILRITRTKDAAQSCKFQHWQRQHERGREREREEGVEEGRAGKTASIVLAAKQDTPFFWHATRRTN